MLPSTLPYSLPRARQRSGRSARPGAYVDRTTVTCDGGLRGKPIAVAGLEATMTDVLVRLETADGRTRTAILKPSRPAFTVPASGGSAGAFSYLRLGVEHETRDHERDEPRLPRFSEGLAFWATNETADGQAIGASMQGYRAAVARAVRVHDAAVGLGEGARARPVDNRTRRGNLERKGVEGQQALHGHRGRSR